jgi:predicted branched-subunit amino acid permease
LLRRFKCRHFKYDPAHAVLPDPKLTTLPGVTAAVVCMTLTDEQYSAGIARKKAALVRH